MAWTRFDSQAPRFRTEVFSREQRCALGVDRTSGEPFLSIPVRNQSVEYEEYYRLTADEHQAFLAEPALAFAFAELCRARKEDARLILKPGSDRGWA